MCVFNCIVQNQSLKIISSKPKFGKWKKILCLGGDLPEAEISCGDMVKVELRATTLLEGLNEIWLNGDDKGAHQWALLL